MQVTKHTSEVSTLALRPKGDFARSPKQGYQWPHKKDLCPQQIADGEPILQSVFVFLFQSPVTIFKTGIVKFLPSPPLKVREDYFCVQ